jgi:hypothetical protein
LLRVTFLFDELATMGTGEQSVATVLVVKVRVKFTLEQPTKTQSWSKVIALLFFKLGSKWGGWSTPRPGRFTPDKEPVTII